MNLRCTVLAAVLATSSPGATLRVSRGGPLQSIAQAVRVAEPGDTIHVTAGVYEGNLVLDKNVTLEGEDGAVIHGSGVRSVITVTAPGCTIRGFTIEHSGDMLVGEDSGILLRAGGTRIENNHLRDVLFGIYLYHADHNVITGNSIEGRAELQAGERGSGIHIWNSSTNTIRNNAIRRTRDGMYLQNAGDSVISGNHVSDLRYGLHYMYSNDNLFENNVFENNVAGAAIMYSQRIVFRRNRFVRNRGFSSFGILFQDSDDCLAEQNVIADNAVGIFMEALRNSQFRGNLIAANDVSLFVFSSAADNVLTRNNFIGNLSPMILVGAGTTMRYDQDRVGNYWSEYEGYDLDGDGIGDVPFPIQNVFEHLEGKYPRLRIFFLSPASQALAFAEKTFPVIRAASEYDRHPLMRPAPLQVSLAQWPEGSGARRWQIATVAFAALIAAALVAVGSKR